MRAGNERLSGNDIVIPVAADESITEGHLVAISAAGYASEASKAENLMIAGCAMKPVDNTGGEDGAVEVQVRRGAFVWNNDGSIKATDVMKPCYVSDAQTVTIHINRIKQGRCHPWNRGRRCHCRDIIGG